MTFLQLLGILTLMAKGKILSYTSGIFSLPFNEQK